MSRSLIGSRRSILLAAVASVSVASLARAQTWDGGGSDDLWGTGANWVGDTSPSPSATTDLTFAGTTRLTPYNNYTDWDDFRSIYFDSTAGSFTLNGNSIDLFGKIENNSTNKQTINFANVGTGTLSGSFIEINPVQGDIDFNSANLYLGNNQLRVWGDNGKVLTFGTGSVISGSGATVAINQNSIVRYQSAHTYTGDTYINAGRLEMLSGSSISGTSTIQLGDTTGTANAEFQINVTSGGYTFSRPITVRSGSSGTKTISSTNTTGTNTISGGITLNAPVTFNVSSGGNLTVAGGTTFSGGTNPLSVTGGGVLQFGNMTSSTVTATWGTTSISGGGSLYYTRSTGHIGSSGAQITLNNGHLRVGADNSATYTYNNPIQVQAGGGSVTAQFTTNNTNLNFSGNFTGAGPLTLRGAGGAGNLGNAGLVVSGSDNSGYTGAAVIESINMTAPVSAGTRPTAVWFSSAGSLLTGASSVTVRDGGVLGVEFAVTDTNLSNVTSGRRGGIGARGSNGTLANLSDPMAHVGPGGFLVLDNFSADANRYNDSKALPMNNVRFDLIGRNAASAAVNEQVGALSLSGGNHLYLNRRNTSNSGVVLEASSLATPGAGSTLLIETGNVTGEFGDGASNSSLSVTGTRPTAVNGMITPAIQWFQGGNNLGHFVTWSSGSTNRLVQATYTDYASDWSGAANTEIVNLTAATTLTGSGDKEIHALRVQSGNQNLGGRTIKLGSGGFITTSATTSNGTLDFGSVHGIIGAYNAASQGTISAKISGSAGITIMGTSQTLNITGSNDFTGGITINGGTVRFSTSGANGNDITINPFGRLTPQASGTDKVGGVSGLGRIAGWSANAGTSLGTLEISPGSGSHEFDGALTNGNDNNRQLAIIKSGNGTQIFGSNSVATYTGSTTINAGKLIMNGRYTGGSAWTVNSGGTLGGNGSISAAVTVNTGGTLAPGNSIGTLSTGNLTLDGTYACEVNATTTTADKANVTGTVSLGALSVLNVSLTGSLTSGQTFTIIDNDDTDAVSGTFNGLLEGAVVLTSSGYDLRISYNTQGAGNDVVLYTTPVPEPGALSLLALGALALRRRRGA